MPVATVVVLGLILGFAEPRLSVGWRPSFGGREDPSTLVVDAPSGGINDTTVMVEQNNRTTVPNLVQSCQCVGADCGCCIYMNVPRIRLNTTGCVNVTYNPDQYALSFIVSLGDSIVFNRTISGRDPPRMCFTAPQFDRVAQLCLRFYNMSYGRKEVTGCIRVEAELFSEVVASYELGCFDIDDVRNRIRDKWVDIKPFHKLWDADLQRNLTGTILRDTNDASRRSR